MIASRKNPFVSILVVDDESDVRQVLRCVLESEGYCVSEAEDGEQALQLLRYNKFDLMILDLVMPKLTGEELLDILGEDRLKELPTIILSAKLEKCVVRKKSLDHIAFYVLKPFKNSNIRELVKFLISNPSSRELIEAEKSYIDL